MTYWKLISTGDPVQTGDPVGSDRITTSPARAGTGEPLHRLEPVPVRPESDRYHTLLLINKERGKDETCIQVAVR